MCLLFIKMCLKLNFVFKCVILKYKLLQPTPTPILLWRYTIQEFSFVLTYWLGRLFHRLENVMVVYGEPLIQPIISDC